MLGRWVKEADTDKDHAFRGNTRSLPSTRNLSDQLVILGIGCETPRLFACRRYTETQSINPE
jgi:hypothetical protein